MLGASPKYESNVTDFDFGILFRTRRFIPQDRDRTRRFNQDRRCIPDARLHSRRFFLESFFPDVTLQDMTPVMMVMPVTKYPSKDEDCELKKLAAVYAYTCNHSNASKVEEQERSIYNMIHDNNNNKI